MVPKQYGPFRLRVVRACYLPPFKTMTGTIISTVVLILLPELLRSLQDYRMLIYAVVLILIMLVTNNDWLKTKWKSLFARKAKGGASNG